MEVRAVERALIIMEALNENVQGLSELSRSVALSKATLLRILGTLIKYEYVTYNKETQKYDLGMKLLKMGMTISDRFDLKKVAEPFLTYIWNASGETVYLNVRNGNERLSIDCLNGKRSVRVVAHTGQSTPLHVAASGMAILAFLDREEIEVYLRNVRFFKFAPGTIDSIDALRAELEKTRERGYAVSFEGRMADAKGVSAPIREVTGRVIASISMTVPTSRTDEEFESYIKLATEAAANISTKLGYSSAENLDQGAISADCT
jgi:IclR family KDG regulon transcriptional repressor